MMTCLQEDMRRAQQQQTDLQELNQRRQRSKLAKGGDDDADVCRGNGGDDGGDGSSGEETSGDADGEDGATAVDNGDHECEH